MQQIRSPFSWRGHLARALTLVAVICAWACGPCHGGEGNIVYVNNVAGSDEFDGTREARGKASSGPVASLDRAIALLKPSGKLVLAKTNAPYRGSIRLINLGGTSEHPLVVEGNGAIVEGIGPTKPSDWQDEGNGIVSTKWEPSLGFFVVFNGAQPKWGKSKSDLQPGESFGDYEAHRGYFRLPEGKSPSDCTLEIPAQWNGAMIYDSDNIIIRDLHARYYLNDGFNFGGRSENLHFENVEGSYNGDEGFSAHGDANAYVADSRFHHNDNGIADTVYSRTSFQRVSVYENRTMGVWFLGGEHSLVNVKLWANPTGVVVEPIYPLPLPGHEFHPYRSARVMMRNVHVKDGAAGLQLAGDSSVTVDYCTFVDQPVGIILQSPESRLHMINSIVQPKELAIRNNGGRYFGDYNGWSASKPAVVEDQEIPARQWFARQQIEQHSVFGDNLLDSRDSPALGKAFIDPDYQAWMRSSMGWPADHPPTLRTNLGAEATGDGN